MKTLFAGILLFAGLFTTLEFNASPKNTSLNEDRIISVTGSADVTIQPNEIELEIELKEYNDILSNSLGKIESKFFRILEKHNIEKDKVTLSDAHYDWYRWWRHRRHNHYKTKTLRVTLDIDTDFLALVKDLDYKGISSLRISNTSNSRLKNYAKKLKSKL